MYLHLDLVSGKKKKQCSEILKKKGGEGETSVTWGKDVEWDKEPRSLAPPTTWVLIRYFFINETDCDRDFLFAKNPLGSSYM